MFKPLFRKQPELMKSQLLRQKKEPWLPMAIFMSLS